MPLNSASDLGSRAPFMQRKERQGLDLTAPRSDFPDAMDLDAVPKHVGSQQAFDIINEA